MIRSMTGFGREHAVIGGYDITVEIRSVNSRYYEFTAKLPRSYMYLEEKLKTLLNGKISRGKVEISVSLYNIQNKETLVTVNRVVVENYVTALREAGKSFSLADNLSVSDIFNMTDAFTVVRADIDEEAVWDAVKTTADAALDRFVAMRENEGARMKADVLDKLAGIEAMVGEIEKYSPENVRAYRERLNEKMSEILADKQIDEQRILLEAALFADKTAVDEETVRLHSHFEQFRAMLGSEDIVGRKLDFLVQELNRETNTIGSKAQDLRITRLVVDIKSEIEKIREQIQNIE